MFAVLPMVELCYVLVLSILCFSLLPFILFSDSSICLPLHFRCSHLPFWGIGIFLPAIISYSVHQNCTGFSRSPLCTSVLLPSCFLHSCLTSFTLLGSQNWHGPLILSVFFYLLLLILHIAYAVFIVPYWPEVFSLLGLSFSSLGPVL